MTLVEDDEQAQVNRQAFYLSLSNEERGQLLLRAGFDSPEWKEYAVGLLPDGFSARGAPMSGCTVFHRGCGVYFIAVNNQDPTEQLINAAINMHLEHCPAR